MKVFIIMICVASTGCASWTPQQKTMAGMALTLQAVDATQTTGFIDNPKYDTHEANPLFNGSAGTMIAFKLASSAVILTACHFLPEKRRELLLKSWMFLGAGCVTWNFGVDK